MEPELDHVLGTADARIHVVEYFDFECPFCARATGMWRDVHEHFGEQVQFAVRHLPLTGVHPRAFEAALASEAAANQGRFWEMYNVLFDHQSALEPGDLHSYAEAIGLDMDLFRTDCADDDVRERVRASARSAHASGARGTPTFYIDGIRHHGPHDARTLIAAIERRLATPQQSR